MQLENKIALVTGASRGIGKSIVALFAEHGAKVYFTYKNSENEAKKLEEMLTKKHYNVKAIQCDGANFTMVENTIDFILENHTAIDILVNNSGVNKDNLLIRYTEEDFNYIINNNLKTVFNFTKAIQKTMLRKKSGSIINISSVIGISGNGGQTLYSASKAGIIAFSKSIAQELGSRNIRCNVIAPGFIETDMTSKLSQEQQTMIINNTALKKLGTPEDVANLALFLASDFSTYITGEVIKVCGGLR